jgi:transcriptional regulator with XRE-family HTH domain
VKFGREIRRRRLALGITLEQLAERARLTPNYIGSIEAGQRDPSLSTVIGLAKGLGVPPGEILGGVSRLSPAALEAARVFDSVPPDMQEAVLKLLRALSARARRRGL